MDRASGHSLVWQAQSTGGWLMAPTLLCARLPGAAARAALEQACQQARIMTRRWYQPLLQHMDVLQKRCLSLDMPNVMDLEQTLLGLPFFLGMAQQQRLRLCAVVAKTMGSLGQ